MIIAAVNVAIKNSRAISRIFFFIEFLLCVLLEIFEL